jgi:hypothetical protein
MLQRSFALSSLRAVSRLDQAKHKISGEPKFSEGRHVLIRRVLCEAAEHDPGNIAGRSGDLGNHRPDRDLRGPVRRKAKGSSRYGREGDRSEPMGSGQIDSGSIAGGQQSLLTAASAAPNRTDGMNYVFGWQPVAARDLSAARCAAAEHSAFFEEFFSCSIVNGAVNTAATEERAVRSINDGVDS